MRKILLLGLALLLLGTTLFADDAKVMPARVGRFYMAPNFSFADTVFDSVGERVKNDDGSIKIFNLGFALEYGIIPWITGALQWVPGVTVWSDLEAATGVEKTNTNGVGDLFLGAKIQIIGENAPVQTDMFRLAIAPGLKIPLPGPDCDEQVKNVAKGEKATFNNMDNHVWAAGGRFYFDYVINKNFFINIYNETLFNVSKQDLSKAGPNLAGAKAAFSPFAAGAAGLGAGLAGAGAEHKLPDLVTLGNGLSGAATQLLKAIKDLDGTVDYKYQLTFEIEPQFTTSIADGIVFSAGLPINYKYKPAFKYSITGYDEMMAKIAGVSAAMAAIANDPTAMTVPGIGEGIGELLAGGGMMPTSEKDLLGMMQINPADSHVLYVNPNVSVFFMKFFLPLEFKLQYNIPVWGQSSQATNTIALQIKAYFKI